MLLEKQLLKETKNTWFCEIILNKDNGDIIGISRPTCLRVNK